MNSCFVNAPSPPKKKPEPKDAHNAHLRNSSNQYSSFHKAMIKLTQCLNPYLLFENYDIIINPFHSRTMIFHPKTICAKFE